MVTSVVSKIVTRESAAEPEGPMRGSLAQPQLQAQRRHQETQDIAPPSPMKIFAGLKFRAKSP